MNEISEFFGESLVQTTGDTPPEVSLSWPYPNAYWQFIREDTRINTALVLNMGNPPIDGWGSIRLYLVLEDEEFQEETPYNELRVIWTGAAQVINFWWEGLTPGTTYKVNARAVHNGLGVA